MAGPLLAHDHRPDPRRLAGRVQQAAVSPGGTAEAIPALRAAVASQTPSDEVLRRGGTIEFAEHDVPGFEGSQDLTALVLRLVRRSGPLPCILSTANGGKIMRGTHGVTQVELDWVVDLGVVLVVVSPPVGPEDPYPALAGQVLGYPVLDDREITASSRYEGKTWDRTSNRTG